MLAKQFLTKRLMASSALKAAPKKAQRSYVVMMKNNSSYLKACAIGTKVNYGSFFNK